MNKEIKLVRGWTLTKYDDGDILVCDAALDTFIHADNVKLNTPTRGETFLTLKRDNRIVASIWLSTEASIKRVQNLLKEA